MDFSEALDTAVKREEEAYAFYSWAKDAFDSPALKALLEELAREELSHKETLLTLESGGVPRPVEVTDMGLTDNVVVGELRPDASPREIIRYAIAKEVEAYTLYENMRASTDDPKVKELLNFIASQERLHKRRLEDAYETAFTPEN